MHVTVAWTKRAHAFTKTAPRQPCGRSRSGRRRSPDRN